MSGSSAGGTHKITRLAPASRCLCISARLRGCAVASTVTSTPRACQHRDLSTIGVEVSLRHGHRVWEASHDGVILEEVLQTLMVRNVADRHDLDGVMLVENPK